MTSIDMQGRGTLQIPTDPTTEDGARIPANVTVSRRTRQRDAVRQLLAKSSEFRTAQDVHDVLRERGETVGLATVYRTLAAMAESGEVDALRTADGQTAYRRCSSGHHHHLICRACGRTVEIALPTVETWVATLGDAYGFTDIDHEIELFGRCGTC